MVLSSVHTVNKVYFLRSFSLISSLLHPGLAQIGVSSLCFYTCGNQLLPWLVRLRIPLSFFRGKNIYSSFPGHICLPQYFMLSKNEMYK